MAVLTANMTSLRNEFNRWFPFRGKDSDGWIGDYAHSQGTSGHNPDDTSHDNAEWDGDSDNVSEVRAIDVDKDLNDPMVTMHDVINHLRTVPNLSSVLRYMIYDRKIYRAANGFNPVPYEGDNPHDKHAHFSGAYSQAADNNGTFDWRFEQMATVELSSADITKIANKVVQVLTAAATDNAEPDDLGFQLRRQPWAYPAKPGQMAINVFTDMSDDVKVIRALVEGS